MEIKVGHQTFRNNCILKIENVKYQLKFIKIELNRHSIELQKLNSSEAPDVIGEYIDGKIATNGRLFHAELVK